MQYEAISITDFVDEFFEGDQNGQSHSVDDELDGKAWIKDGRVYCKTTKGIHPVLTVPEDVIVLIDGNAFNGRTLVLSDNEKYELVSEVIVKETEWQVTMNSDKLEVHLHVEPGYRLEYDLLDNEPKQYLEPSLLEKKQVKNNLQLSQIIEKLGLLHVKAGFHHIEMVKATQTTENGTFLVASGRTPLNGKNGWFESKVSTKVEKGFKENDQGRVDFREVKAIPLVEKGSLIGIIHPPTAGQLGYTVTNESILCEQTFPLKVQIGKGILLLKDKIIATEAGRPQIEQRGQLVKADIIQKLTHIGNVDLSSGNIKFKGDVEVFGEIMDHMSVEASGEVVIHNAVNNATISTGRSVELHSNCNGSKITAGDKDFFEKELITHSKTIIATMEKLFALLAVVTGSDTFMKNAHTINIQPLTRMLIEKKFPDFPHTIKTFIASVKGMDDSFATKGRKQICHALERTFLSLAVEADFQELLQQLLIDMKGTLDNSSETVSTESFINLPNAMNSNLFCKGDISITDKGCINTDIQAGGHVHIAGILRGGRIFADEGVTVGEAGSINSSLTIIEVPYNQTIRIDRALEGLVLKIGRYTHQFTEESHNVKGYVNKEDRIVVEYGRNGGN